MQSTGEEKLYLIIFEELPKPPQADLRAVYSKDKLVKQLQEEYEVDLTILNCENSAAGFGVTPKIADEFFDWGIDVLTSGNHIWDKKEIMPYLDENRRILRPANYPADNPGKFIVPTQGKVKQGGAVILSMVIPDEVSPQDTIKVSVRRMKFLKE